MFGEKHLRILPWVKSRFLGLFLVAILIPGIVLGIFAFRFLQQDRVLEERRLRERIEGAAERAAVRMGEEWRHWEDAVEEISLAPDPERHAETLVRPGVIVIAQGGRIVRPRGSLAYRLGRESESTRNDPVRPAFLAVESLELGGRNLRAVLRQYQRLLDEAEDPAARAWLLHRVGRTLRKLGRRQEALNTFAELVSRSSGTVAGLPVSLLGHFEICTLLSEQDHRDRLFNEASLAYEELVTCTRLALPKERYLFYSQTLRSWLGTRVPPAILAREKRRLQLSEAAEQTLSSRLRLYEDSEGPLVTMAAGTDKSRSAVLLTARYFSEDLWPKLQVARDSDLTLGLTDSSGKNILGEAEPGSFWAAESDLIQIGLPWKVVASPIDAGLLLQQVRFRQKLYLGLLLMLAGLLAFGSYMTVRIVRRELEVSQLKANFVATVSHEFRSPLTGIRQLAEMLSRGRVKTEEKRAQYLSLIHI